METYMAEHHAPGEDPHSGHAKRASALLREALIEDNELREVISSAVQAGIVRGAKAVVEDTDFMQEFWHEGYEQLVNKGRDDVQKSVGKRLLQWLAGVLFGIGLYALGKSGLLK
jgi:protein-disulfide isomerase